MWHTHAGDCRSAIYGVLFAAGAGSLGYQRFVDYHGNVSRSAFGVR